ncbi:MAG: response regulator transcription factor [Candidatus Levybacteria bacterium]|nr:response regulator transcription factor [Candidatus Levybacteria bacterium]
MKKSMKKKILIADDDKGIVTALTMMLEDAYEVTATDNGQTVRQANNIYPDLILLDIWMGDVDGRDICKQLKNQVSTMDIPIIMISARANAEKSALSSGADAFIAKPFEMDDLLKKIGQHII